MIKSVGIDLGGIGEHRVRCLDEEAQMCDGVSFDTTRVGLAKLEERIFKDGSNPVIVFEPTGLAWLLVAVYLKSRYPDSRLVRVQAQKVVALRKYLNRSSKSDKELRRERRRRKTPGSPSMQKKLREMLVPRILEAAETPQPVVI